MYLLRLTYKKNQSTFKSYFWTGHKSKLHWWSGSPRDRLWLTGNTHIVMPLSRAKVSLWLTSGSPLAQLRRKRIAKNYTGEAESCPEKPFLGVFIDSPLNFEKKFMYKKSTPGKKGLHKTIQEKQIVDLKTHFWVCLLIPH